VLAAAKAKGGAPPQERSAGTGDSLGKLWLCASSLVHSCGAVTTSGSPGGPAPAVQPKKGFEEVWTTNLNGIVLMPGPLCHAVSDSSWCARQCVGIATSLGVPVEAGVYTLWLPFRLCTVHLPTSSVGIPFSPDSRVVIQRRKRGSLRYPLHKDTRDRYCGYLSVVGALV